MEDFENKFTFVTGCAATIPSVLFASVYSIHVLCCKQWSGYIKDKLITVVKHSVDGIKDIRQRYLGHEEDCPDF